MKIAAMMPVLLALAACRGGADDAWRPRQVAWERTPEVRSAGEAEALADALKQKPSITLGDAYRLALHRSETVAIDTEELTRIQSLHDQFVGAIMPRVSLKGSYTRQDTSGTGSSGTANNFVFKDRPQLNLNVRQPIFSGLKEYYAIRQSDALYAAQEHVIRQATLELYAGVAESFHDVLQVGRDLATTEHTLALARERLEELVQRNRIGITRRSEVLAQEAQVSFVEARVESLKGAIAVAWEAFKFVTGVPGRPDLVDAPAPAIELSPVAALIARALENRSDLRARRKQAEAAGEAIGVAESGYYPVVAVEGNYYIKREGAAEDVDWDLVLTGEIPLFDGFTTAARVREAESNSRIARLELDRLQRQIELDISRVYADVKSFQAQIASLETAVASAQENYEIVQAEYRQGIVANVEVLASFETLQQATLDRDQTRTLLRLAIIRLSVAGGHFPEEMK